MKGVEQFGSAARPDRRTGTVAVAWSPLTMPGRQRGRLVNGVSGTGAVSNTIAKHHDWRFNAGPPTGAPVNAQASGLGVVTQVERPAVNVQAAW